nr:hypothetical protein [Saprospiraceae bacterium]
MKNLLTIFGTLFLTLNLSAQDLCNTYFPFEHFQSMTYEDYDRRDRLQATQTWKVTDLSTVNGARVAAIHQVIKDEDGEVVVETDFTARCENETYYISLEAFHLNEFAESMGGDIEIEATGNAMSLPDKLEVGMELPDANLNMEIVGGIIPMNIEVNITDRKVESKEEVTVPAGTFEAYKITQETAVRAGIRVTTTSHEYIVPEYGMVKSENFNRRGRSQGYTQLVEVVRW